MTILGYDLSRFDSVADVRPEFVILNVEDPGCSGKAHVAHAGGIVWGLYSWVYPRDNGYSATRSKAMGDLLELDGIGQPPAGHWLDYEQGGVAPQDLINAYAHGVDHLGVYTYLYIVNTIGAGVLGDHPLWLAYYPGNNDGSYPAGHDGDARRWGAKLWQYSSTNGTLDRDAVIDDAWWHQWTSSTGDGELSMGDINTIGEWMKDDRRIAFGDLPAGSSNVIGTWMRQQTDRVLTAIAALESRVDQLGSQVGTGGAGMSEEAVRAIVREELDKTTLGTAR